MAKKTNGAGKIEFDAVLLAETPGALRFQEVNAQGEQIKKDEQGVYVGTLYTRKAKMGEAKPQKVHVTITW